MINFHRGNSRMEMLRNFLIFCLCIVAANAESKFYVLNAPDSLKFSSAEALNSVEVGAVALASTGSWISNDATWGGLYIKDPFNLPSLAVVVHIESAPEIAFRAPAKEYSVAGNNVADGLSTLSEHVNSNAENKVEICNINFNDFDAAVKALKACFPAVEVAASQSIDSLDVDKPEDKLLLNTVGAINAMAETADKLVKSAKFVVIHYSLEALRQSHSEAESDAVKLLGEAVSNLKEKIVAAKASQAVVFAVVTENPLTDNVANDSSNDQFVRKKRELLAGSNTNTYNLAVYYDQNYPVIFNIILWFMVAFGLSLLAICYAIGDMDPGRDSIIYRMTSTRMKKDN